MATKKEVEPKAEVTAEKKDKPYLFEGVELKFNEQGKYDTGRKVPFKNMKTIKALQVDADGQLTGNVVQLPWELTVNNGVAGDESDQIGLKKYERKGFVLLIDEAGEPIYSTLWDEWSKYDAAYDKKIRNRFRGEPGKFSMNATTSASFTNV